MLEVQEWGPSLCSASAKGFVVMQPEVEKEREKEPEGADTDSQLSLGAKLIPLKDLIASQATALGN